MATNKKILDFTRFFRNFGKIVSWEGSPPPPKTWNSLWPVTMYHVVSIDNSCVEHFTVENLLLVLQRSFTTMNYGGQ